MLVLVGVIMATVGVVGVLATLLALPGAWLIVAVAAGVDLWRPETYSLTTLLVAAGLALSGEIVELIASAAGAKKAGGARRSALGAIIGAIAGAIIGTPFFPVVGTILGAAIGAGLLAGLLERTKTERTWGDAWRVGQGAAVGRFLATIFKTLIAAAIAIELFIAAIV